MTRKERDDPRTSDGPFSRFPQYLAICKVNVMKRTLGLEILSSSFHSALKPLGDLEYHNSESVVPFFIPLSHGWHSLDKRQVNKRKQIYISMLHTAQEPSGWRPNNPGKTVHLCTYIQWRKDSYVEMWLTRVWSYGNTAKGKPSTAWLFRRVLSFLLCVEQGPFWNMSLVIYVRHGQSKNCFMAIS